MLVTSLIWQMGLLTSQEFYLAPRSKIFYRTPPLPRPSPSLVKSRFSWWSPWARSDGFAATTRNGTRLRSGSNRRLVRIARLSTATPGAEPCAPGGSFAATARHALGAGGPSASGMFSAVVALSLAADGADG